MSANSLNRPHPRYVRGLIVAAWAAVAFVAGQLLAGIFMIIVSQLVPRIGVMNEAVMSSLLAFLGYLFALLIAVYVPRTLGYKLPSLKQLGLHRLVTWSDIGIGLLAIVPYFIISGALVWLATALYSSIDVNQQQAIPFSNIAAQFEYLVAFVTLVVLAPFAEELFFRGYLLGKMKQLIQPWVAVVLVAALFGALHLPGEIGSPDFSWQWLVGIDTFALALVMGAMRLWTGSIWAGVILHMLKNFIAFYFLFIYRG